MEHQPAAEVATQPTRELLFPLDQATIEATQLYGAFGTLHYVDAEQEEQRLWPMELGDGQMYLSSHGGIVADFNLARRCLRTLALTGNGPQEVGREDALQLTNEYITEEEQAIYVAVETVAQNPSAQDLSEEIRIHKLAQLVGVDISADGKAIVWRLLQADQGIGSVSGFVDLYRP